jgi:hypothetical protein
MYYQYLIIYIGSICYRKKMLMFIGHTHLRYILYWPFVKPFRYYMIGERSFQSNKFYIRFRSSIIKYYLVIKSLNDIFRLQSAYNIHLCSCVCLNVHVQNVPDNWSQLIIIHYLLINICKFKDANYTLSCNVNISLWQYLYKHTCS